MQRHAQFDGSRTYRYLLRRAWAEELPRLTFVMLNPSTADEAVEDATIRRCIGFAKREGAGRLDVVNLFAYRSTFPRELARAAEPVGTENDDFLETALHGAEKVIVAWGDGHPSREFQRLLSTRTAAIAARLLARGALCFGRTRRGNPRHPVRLPRDQPLEVWTPTEREPAQ